VPSASGGHVSAGILIPMCAGSLLSVPFSVFAVSQTKEKHLRIIIGVLTVAMGALTIYKAVG